MRIRALTELYFGFALLLVAVVAGYRLSDVSDPVPRIMGGDALLIIPAGRFDGQPPTYADLEVTIQNMRGSIEKLRAIRQVHVDYGRAETLAWTGVVGGIVFVVMGTCDLALHRRMTKE